MTTKENAIHSWYTGLKGYWNSNKNGKLSGDVNGRCKISDEQLRTIRKNYKGIRGEAITLALKYNVNPRHMRKLLNNTYRRRTI